MTYNDGLEGTRRMLKVMATPSPMFHLDDPEGPSAPRSAEELAKSDEFDQDELAQKSPGYAKALVDAAVADAIAPLKAEIAAKDAELKAMELNANSAIRRNPMQWRTLVVLMFSVAVAIGWLYGANSRINEKVDVLMDYYLSHEYGPEAMQGKTCLEVTPQMEAIGINHFITIVRQMPYTDAATLERLFDEEGHWVVAKMWGEGANTVVRLNSWKDDGPFGIFGKTWVGNTSRERSVLIHPNPISLGVYKEEMENDWNRLSASDFDHRKRYDITSEGAMCVATYVATTPAITHEELVKLGDMKLVWDYGNGVLFLTDKFGTEERFVRLADDDYRDSQLRMYFNPNSYVGRLKYKSSSWWYAMKCSTIKEEQTTAKVGE